MPFDKIIKGKDKGKYKSPSGKVMTDDQVQAYYAQKSGKKKKKKKSNRKR